MKNPVGVFRSARDVSRSLVNRESPIRSVSIVKDSEFCIPERYSLPSSVPLVNEPIDASGIGCPSVPRAMDFRIASRVSPLSLNTLMSISLPLLSIFDATGP